MEQDPKRIVAVNLSKWYKEILGVSGVNLEIGRGIVGLVGPNGAGKSTLLHLFCGILRPSQGHVLVLGEPAFVGVKFKRKIGVVLQKDSYYPFMTVLDFTTQMTRLYGFCTREAEELAAKAIERVRLSHKARQRIDHLSKGMRQCLKLAQAIAHDPDILLLDEVLAGCDPLTKHHLKDLLLELQTEGKTVLLSSHNLKEVESVTSQVIVIAGGKVIGHGDIEELLALLPGRVYTVLIHGKGMRKLAQELLSYDDVTGVEVRDEDTIVLQTKDRIQFYSRLPKIICVNRYSVSQLDVLEQDLSSLFKVLVK